MSKQTNNFPDCGKLFACTVTAYDVTSCNAQGDIGNYAFDFFLSAG